LPQHLIGIDTAYPLADEQLKPFRQRRRRR
jgi:hypothetical protein